MCAREHRLWINQEAQPGHRVTGRGGPLWPISHLYEFVMSRPDALSSYRTQDTADSYKLFRYLWTFLIYFRSTLTNQYLNEIRRGGLSVSISDINLERRYAAGQTRRENEHRHRMWNVEGDVTKHGIFWFFYVHQSPNFYLVIRPNYCNQIIIQISTYMFWIHNLEEAKLR